MDRLHEIEVFVAIAEAGGLSRAATRLRTLSTRCHPDACQP